MRTIITSDNKRRYYFEARDLVKQVSTNKIYQIKEVKADTKEIVTMCGETIVLTTDIRPTTETLEKSRIVDRRETNVKDIKVKYFDKDIPRMERLEKGDWVDVRVNNVCIVQNTEMEIKEALRKRNISGWVDNEIEYKKGDVLIMRLGMAMQLPKNNEAELKPRSSTFPTYGLLMGNSVGCIDECYCGNDDEWLIVSYATRDGIMSRYDRVAQFRINEKMPTLNFIEVDSLNNENRGGYGSSGK